VRDPGATMDRFLSSRDIEDVDGSPFVTLSTDRIGESRHEMEAQGPPASLAVGRSDAVHVAAAERASDEVRRMQLAGCVPHSCYSCPSHRTWGFLWVESVDSKVSAC